ncbi:MAG: urease accessory protein UreF [Beijerinckiaceae bacterium]|nr:urease accessory protein UreF [Beijerinckiaceae bacterium]
MRTAQLLLLSWFSPSYPVGAFAYSHGLEWAQEAGDLADASSLALWLTDLIERGAARNDAILAVAAWDAVTAGDWPEVAGIAELALAMAASTERRMETVTQGNAFLLATAAAHPVPELARLRQVAGPDLAYPVAVAVAAAGHGIAKADLLPAFILAFAANLVSAAVRLGIVGQTDGQRVLAGLMPCISKTAAALASASLDDLGACAFRSDLASLRHETQYSRLFRS